MGDIVLKWYKGFCFLVVISIIASCSLIAPMSTTSTTAKQLGFFKTSVEAVSIYYTDKTATDHAVSAVLGKDCKLSRVAKREKLYVTKLSLKHTMKNSLVNLATYSMKIKLIWF